MWWMWSEDSSLLGDVAESKNKLPETECVILPNFQLTGITFTCTDLIIWNFANPNSTLHQCTGKYTLHHFYTMCLLWLRATQSVWNCSVKFKKVTQGSNTFLKQKICSNNHTQKKSNALYCRIVGNTWSSVSVALLNMLTSDSVVSISCDMDGVWEKGPSTKKHLQHRRKKPQLFAAGLGLFFTLTCFSFWFFSVPFKKFCDSQTFVSKPQLFLKMSLLLFIHTLWKQTIWKTLARNKKVQKCWYGKLFGLF